VFSSKQQIVLDDSIVSPSGQIETDISWWELQAFQLSLWGATVKVASF
jgi:hypothetical protein